METGEIAIGALVRLAATRVAQAEARALRAKGVTPAEWALLRALHAAGAVPPSVLADRLGMTRGAVTKLVDRLRAKQLVVRAKGRDDRRMRTLALTGAGARLVPELAATAGAVEAEWAGRMNAATRTALVTGLRDLLRD